MYHGCSSYSSCVKEENKTRAKPPTPCIVKARKRHSVSTFSFRVQIIQKQQQSAETFSGVLYRWCGTEMGVWVGIGFFGTLHVHEQESLSRIRK